MMRLIENVDWRKILKKYNFTKCTRQSKNLKKKKWFKVFSIKHANQIFFSSFLKGESKSSRRYPCFYMVKWTEKGRSKSWICTIFQMVEWNYEINHFWWRKNPHGLVFQFSRLLYFLLQFKIHIFIFSFNFLPFSCCKGAFVKKIHSSFHKLNKFCTTIYFIHRTDFINLLFVLVGKVPTTASKKVQRGCQKKTLT